ncbi:MAG: aminoglycoside phosphotransferase family protein [Pseudonocardiaceae bacterium]
MGWDPDALYRAALCAEGTMSGYYNDNVRVDTSDGPVLVRIPVPRADQMDMRVWDEPDVLRAVSPRVAHSPRLLHVSSDPRFQIHEFVIGRQVNEIAPRGISLPPRVIPDVLVLFDQLATVPLDELPPLPVGWPDDGKCADFARMLSGDTQRVFDENQDEFGDLYRAFAIPDDPLASVVSVWSTLASRPFRLVHADVHRQNMILSPGGVIFLDWELALWGDPVYELAVHVHKMAYLDEELGTLYHDWEVMTTPSAARSWRDDLTTYLRHERIKSALVDSVRYTKEILTPDIATTRRETLIGKLTDKLNAAGQVWGWRTGLSAREVDDIITGIS